MVRRRLRKSKAGPRPGQSNLIRIIGGAHKGRKLRFPTADGLRPTADRVRETLFNWLQPQLPGARCLDLFAGSGALGLEAASRGAAEVLLLERSPRVVEQLRENVALLELVRVQVSQVDTLAWLQGDARPFDILFLDPPFDDDLLGESCRLLQCQGWLAAGARIYLEMDARTTLPELPAEWARLKEKQAGQVCYYLFSSPQ